MQTLFDLIIVGFLLINTVGVIVAADRVLACKVRLDALLEQGRRSK